MQKVESTDCQYVIAVIGSEHDPIDIDWLKAHGFEVEVDGEILESGWKCTFDAWSRQDSKDDLMLHCNSKYEWDISVDCNSVELVDDLTAEEVLTLAKILRIPIKTQQHA